MNRKSKITHKEVNISKKNRSHKKSNRKNRSHRKNRNNKKKDKRHTRRHLYRKHRDIILVPESKGIPLFNPPEPDKKKIINKNILQSGNMIPGLRNM